MAQSVREHIAELAFMKTLGFRDGAVLGFELSESVLIMLIARQLGLGAGWLLCQGIAAALAAFTPGIFVSAEIVLAAIEFMVVTGLLAGVFPALQAVRLSIVDAPARGQKMRAISQITTVTPLNIRNLPMRVATSLVAIVGVVAVLPVFAAVMSMAKEFEPTMTLAGSVDTVIVIRSGSTSEPASGLSIDQVLIIETAPGVLHDGNEALTSPEFFVLVDIPLRGTGTHANVPFRGVGSRALDARDATRVAEGRVFEPGENELIIGRAAQSEFEGLELGATIKFGRTEWQVAGVYSEREFYSARAQGTATFIRVLGYPMRFLMAVGAAFGALNSMYSSVSTRGKEGATLRAVGFGPTSVLVSMVIESTLLAQGIATALVIGLIGGFLPALRNEGLKWRRGRVDLPRPLGVAGRCSGRHSA